MSDEKNRAPLCKICGHRHWGRDPHIFDRKPAQGTSNAPQFGKRPIVNKKRKRKK